MGEREFFFQYIGNVEENRILKSVKLFFDKTQLLNSLYRGCNLKTRSEDL
jgi:hypothetical protein